MGISPVRISDRVDLLRRMPKNAVCAEFGAQRGIFAEKIWEITSPKKLHLIDLWEPVKGLTEMENHTENFDIIHDKFIDKIGDGQVEIIKDDSYSALKRFPDNYFDWVYVDDDPRYGHTRKMLSLLRKKVKATGLICGHNYFDGDSKFFGTIEAVDEFCDATEWHISYLTSPENTVNDSYARFLSYILENKYPKVKETHNPYKNAPDEFFSGKDCYEEVLDILTPNKITEWNEDESIHGKSLQYAVEVVDGDERLDPDSDIYALNIRDQKTAEKIIMRIYDFAKENSVICLWNAKVDNLEQDFEFAIKQFPYVRYFSKDFCVLYRDGSLFDKVEAQLCKELLLVCGTENYFPMAKSVFASAFYSGLWQGEMMFVSDRYSDEIEKELALRNIHYVIINQETLRESSIFNANDLNMNFRKWSNSTLMRYIVIFMDFFKRWDKVLYFDCDITILDKIDFHKQGDFCAVSDWSPIKKTFELQHAFPSYGKVSKELGFESEWGKPFNAGVFSLNTQIIDHDFRKKFFEINMKYLKYSLFSDHLIMNAAFKDHVKYIGEEYNCERDYIMYCLDEHGNRERPTVSFNQIDGERRNLIEYNPSGEKKAVVGEHKADYQYEIVKSKILHCMGLEIKDWNPSSHRFKLWRSYLDSFDSIMLSSKVDCDAAKVGFDQEKAKIFSDCHYNDYLSAADREELIKTFPKRGIGLQIGARKGEFTEKLFQFTNPAMMYVIDFWEHQSGTGFELDGANNEDHNSNYFECCERMRNESISGRLAIMKGDSKTSLDQFPDNYFDWVYLDGNKTYGAMMETLVLLERKVKQDGIISGHDYFIADNMDYGVLEAVRDFCLEKGWHLDNLTKDTFPTYSLKRGEAMIRGAKFSQIRKEVKPKISVCIPIKMDRHVDNSFIDTSLHSLLEYSSSIDEILIGFDQPRESSGDFKMIKHILDKYRGYGKIKFLFYSEVDKILPRCEIAKRLAKKAKNDVLLFWDIDSILMQDFEEKYKAIKNSLVRKVYFFDSKVLEERDRFSISKKILRSYYYYRDSFAHKDKIDNCFIIHKSLFDKVKDFYLSSYFFVNDFDALIFGCNRFSISINKEILNSVRQKNFEVSDQAKKEKESRFNMSPLVYSTFDDLEYTGDLDAKFFDYDYYQGKTG